MSMKRIDKGRSILYAQLKTMDEYNDILYAPFDFKFSAHSEQKAFEPPWYSGMSQGICLSAVTRLDCVDQS